MILRASLEFQNELLQLPESGMGYQVVFSYNKKKGEAEKLMVFNSKLILPMDSSFTYEVRQVKMYGFIAALNSANLGSNFGSPVLAYKSSLIESRTQAADKFEKFRRRKGGIGAVDSNPRNCYGEEMFVRLSAYEDDTRVDEIRMCFRPGTYATTFEDFQTCKSTGDNPVDRYALPNDETIKWAFYCKPLVIDKVRMGIVQPANGHDGGGVEGLFDNGTSSGTYFLKSNY